MKPLKENEVLYLPDGAAHTCPHCGLWARGAHDIDRVFGFRRHNYAPRKDGSSPGFDSPAATDHTGQPRSERVYTIQWR